LSSDPYNAEATIEEPLKALAIPIQRFLSLIETSADFRELVFSSFALRLSAMMAKVEEVISVPIDQRLAIRALELRAEQHPIVTTHEQLAADLGTAREVVSRKLAIWEKKGWIKRGRGCFSITNKRQLECLAYDDR
jgi:CRP/FNR family transcriptional regulator